MNQSPKNPNAHRIAFTLVEVLVALALSSLLVGVTGSILVSVVQTRTLVERDIAMRTRVARVFDRIERDVRNVLPASSKEEPSVRVFGSPQQVMQLSVLTGMADDGSSLHQQKHPAVVRYRLVRDTVRRDRRKLVREVIDQTKINAAPVRETVAYGLAQFAIETITDARDSARPKNDSRDKPRALRITCRWNDGQTPHTRSFVLEHN